MGSVNFDTFTLLLLLGKSVLQGLAGLLAVVQSLLQQRDLRSPLLQLPGVSFPYGRQVYLMLRSQLYAGLGDLTIESLLPGFQLSGVLL